MVNIRLISLLHVIKPFYHQRINVGISKNVLQWYEGGGGSYHAAL